MFKKADSILKEGIFKSFEYRIFLVPKNDINKYNYLHLLRFFCKSNPYQIRFLTEFSSTLFQKKKKENKTIKVKQVKFFADFSSK